MSDCSARFLVLVLVVVAASLPVSNAGVVLEANNAALPAYAATSLRRYAAAASKAVTISNTVPRVEAGTETIMDAHDSKMVFSNGVYYWFAASYGQCQEPEGDSGCSVFAIGACGFRTDHNVTLFTSTDLAAWKNEGVVFSAAGQLPDNSVLFAPKTVFNPRTNKWVMWFNYIVNTFSTSYYGVAEADTPQGPFVMVVPQVKTLRYEDNGDENLFVDPADGAGYLIYTTLSLNHGISIERLTDDYHGTLGEQGSSGVFGDTFSEAPMMFKRGALYYVVFGSCCCYCGSGSSVNVYTSAAAMGPYTKRTNLGDLRSQSTDIFSYVDGAGEEQFMYIGDHWQSAPDRIKAHDFTVWAPLQFSADGLDVTVPGGGFQDSFNITVA